MNKYVTKNMNVIEVNKYKKLKKEFFTILENEYSRNLEDYQKQNCLDYILNNYHNYNFNNCDHEEIKKMIRDHKVTFDYFIY